MTEKVTIDICDKFNLIDVRRKCPYAKDTLCGENIEQAMNDLKRCFVVCDSTPEVYMFKDYDAIEERPKVSYTSEAVARQKLKKVIIGKVFRDNKLKPYSLWDVFTENQLEFTVKALKFYSEDEQIFSYFRGYDYKQLEEIQINPHHKHFDKSFDKSFDKNILMYNFD